MHSEKVTVWCRVAYFGIIGPYFFENENGETVTVTNESYTSMIQDFSVAQKRERNLNGNLLWF